LLIKEVVQGYGGRVEFKSENWGESTLAEHYGVKKYPVVFVDDILLAQPNDFGWYGAKGKYTPWRDKANHEKFKRELTRMIGLVLGGQKAEAAASGQSKVEEEEIAQLPGFTAQDLQGRVLDAKSFAGRVVVVEFWATWCPPCRATLSWLAEIKKRYGERVAIVAIAVESEEKEVRELTALLQQPVNVVMGSESLVNPFGTLGSVPRMFVFASSGKTAAVFYGAPEGLHEKVGRLIDSLLVQGAAGATLQDAGKAERVTAAEVFNAARDAMGGENALRQVRNLRAVADCVGPRGKYTTELISVRPDRLYFKQTWATRDPFVAFVNGQYAWLKNEKNGEVSRAEREVAAAVRSHDFQMIAIAPLERFRDAAVVGFEDFAGAPSVKIRATDELGKPLYLFFNRNTRLMSGMLMADSRSQTGETVKVVFNEWKNVGNARLPSKVTATDRAGDFVLDFREILLNQAEGQIFQVPPEVTGRRK
jgi:thiol-disulfide isomerase/thioredoxin